MSFRTRPTAAVSAVKWEAGQAPAKKVANAEHAAPLTANEMFREKKRAEANARDTGAKAICRIKLSLRQPDAQADGRAVTLEDWDTDFKPALGSYKKFLLSRPDQFRIVEGSEVGIFTLEIVSNDVVAAPNWEDIAWAKGKGKGWGKGKGKMSKDGSMPAPFPSAKGKGKAGKADDKGKGKGKYKGKNTESGTNAAKLRPPPVSTLSLRVLAERAVSEIKRALLSEGCQADGRPYMPQDWTTRYAPTLGPYMDFLLTRPDQFCLVEGRPGSYTIEVISSDGVAVPERAARAVRQLAKAAQDELATGQEFEENPEEAEPADEADGEAEAGEEAEEEAEAGAGEDAGDGEEGAEGEDAGAEEDEDWAAAVGAADAAFEDSDEDPAFPVERAAKHGSYIRSLLSAGILGPPVAKRARTDA